ncbi:MAG: hypothetical protein M1132_10975 [Chloroflexi bacterium]|nr:hypothetical protein [Chloroflexota bacterium]
MTELPRGYGRRYMTAHEFSSLCSESNVQIDSFNKDLELFEKEHILLPVARVVKPAEYVSLRRGLDEQGDTYGQPLPGWDDLERLVYSKGVPQPSDEEALWHPFDQEFKYENQFLSRPLKGTFQPWKLYWEDGQAVEHYYHYWQIHQVYAVLERYPIFAKYNWILQNLTDKVHDRMTYLIPEESEPALTIGGKTLGYDALSFYIEVYGNERWRTFSHVPEIEGIKRLNEAQYEEYRTRQEGHAKSVAARWGLSTDYLIEFLLELLDLRAHYEDSERAKLAEGLTSDLRYLWVMIANITGQSFDEISEVLGQRGLIWPTRFRALEEGAQIQDCVKDYFNRLRQSYAEKFPSSPFSEQDANDLLRFVLSLDLVLLPHAIYELHKTLNDSRRRSVLSLYVDMKNLSTSFEYFVREIAGKSLDANAHAKRNQPRGNTLRPLVRSLMQGQEWLALFESSAELGRATSPDGFVQNIAHLLSDPVFCASEENEVARLFLLVENARNVMVHFYTVEDRLFGSLRGDLFTAVIHAMMYTWRFAKGRGLLADIER